MDEYTGEVTAKSLDETRIHAIADGGSGESDSYRAVVVTSWDDEPVDQ